MKRALVCGGGGFIGSHLVCDLKKRGYWVRAVDLKYPEFDQSAADEFQIADLREAEACHNALEGGFEEVYQLAADMGGAGYLFTKDNDADIMHNSIQINLHFARLCSGLQDCKIFYSSSACVYPEYNQIDPTNPNCAEDSTLPAAPDSCYGWEKLFSEQLYLAYHRNHGLNVRIARFHNIFGSKGSWNNGKEKAPAAIARKVAQADQHGSIEIWGPGDQTRSFLHIDECLEAIRRFMESDFTGPLNIGSDQLVSINNLARLTMQVACKDLRIINVPGPLGVMGRNSDNTLIKEKLDWAPSMPLRDEIRELYSWIKAQVEKQNMNDKS